MSEPTKGPTAPVASNMTAAPNEAKSQMVQPEAKKKVKIKALRAIWIGDKTLAPGAETLVDEEDAIEFCDRKFDCGYSFTGERGIASAEKHVIVRAVRVTDKVA